MKEKESHFSGKTLLILLAAIALACLFIFHNYLLGDKLMAFIDVGADTKEQYLMFYNNIANYLREGHIPAWDFYNGYGATSFEMNLFSPFLWILYLIGYVRGPQHIIGAIVYLIILEILLAGAFCYLMLSQYAFTEEAKFLAAFMYAFNGFLLLWGQHPGMGCAVVYLPLFMYFIRKSYTRKRAYLGLALVSGLALMTNFYLAYMILLGMGIYVTIKVLLFDRKPMKEKGKHFFALALSMACGIGLGAASLFPNLMAVAGSSRLDSDQSLLMRIITSFKPWEREYYRTMVYRLFGTNLQGAGTAYLGSMNYYEAPILFFSVLFIFVLIQYLFTIHKREETKTQKLIRYIVILLFVFSLVIEAGSLPFNAFAYRFARQTFLFMPFFALISAEILTNTLTGGSFSWTGLVLFFITVVGVYGKSYLNYVRADYETNALNLGIAGVVMAVVIALMRGKKLDREKGLMILFAALFVSTVSDSALSYRYRDTVSKLDSNYFEGTYTSDTTEALNWIRENDPEGFYRIEKDYRTAAGFLESMAQHYYGVSTYDSKPTVEQNRFFAHLWPQTNSRYDTIHHTFRNSVQEDVMATLSGVKYVLSKYPTLSAGNYERVHKCGKVYIFRNKDTDNIGKFYTQTVNENVFKAVKDDLEVWNVLPEVMLTDHDLEGQLDQQALLEKYHEVEVDHVVDLAATAEAKLTKDGITMKAVDKASLYLNTEVLKDYEQVTAEFVINTKGDLPLDIYTGDERPNFYLNHTTGEYRLSLPEGTQQIDFNGYDDSAPYEIVDFHIYGSKRTAFDDTAEFQIEKPKGSTVSGSVETKQDGFVMLAIPYQKGWRLEVDGEKTEIIKGDFQFISFKCKAGTHTFKASYEAPGFRISVYMTLISACLWVLAFVVSEIIGLTSGIRGKFSARKTKAAEYAEDPLNASQGEHAEEDQIVPEGNAQDTVPAEPYAEQEKQEEEDPEIVTENTDFKNIENSD